MSRKVAVYAGTSNLYPQMYTALKSLILNNRMDRVYLLIDTDEFPYEVPGDIVTIINVSDQEFFPKDSPNYRNRYSYMTLMRCVLATMFKDEDRILWLDCDTIVDDDISDLFTMDMSGYLYAGVMEPGKSRDIFRYINAGVLLCNAELLRYGKEQEMLTFLNTFPLNWLDQDAINLLCQGYIRLIGSEYNMNNYVMPCIRPKIIHYAAVKDFSNEFYYKKYERLELAKKAVDDRQ